MKRRDFLKGAAGLVIACGVGFGLNKITRILAPDVSDAVGPMLVEGLSIDLSSNGADVYSDGMLAFQVNSTGARLLRYADGRKTLAQIIALSDCQAEAGAAAAFFIALGKAGYLQNRLEVTMLESQA